MSKTSSNPALEPAVFVIFGITGDLSRRYLLPALYHLVKEDLLHEHTEILGITRRNVTSKELLDSTELCVHEIDGVCDTAIIKKMHDMISMKQMDLTDGTQYENLKKTLDDIENKHNICMNRLFYLSIPPQVYGPIVRQLGEHGLQDGCSHGTARSRLLAEKPFGYDLCSAEDLIRETGKYFAEEQIFRIDHYVAKETVQNILTFRSANPLFETIWNNQHISHIQVTATEQIGIEGRAIFYEELGALKDFVQSHLLQLLAILAMEQPLHLTSNYIHTAKLNLLNCVKPIAEDMVWEQTVRGQYEGYKQEVNNLESNRETYAAIQLSIDNDRWRNVPILIRTGKALDKKETKLSIIFRGSKDAANSLRFRIQPHEGIALHVLAKKPGYDDTMQPVVMDFSYQQTFDDHGHPDAYERVLVDAVRGDRTLFSTSDEVLASWRILENAVQAWNVSGRDLKLYKKGSSGPQAAVQLANNAGCGWL
jgi:glucose-6-phosphate 1-dehydrogenase